MSTNRTFFVYAFKLLLIYFILDYGTTFYIGITSPGGKYYVAWLNKYFNYVSWLRYAILLGSKGLLSLLGYESSVITQYILKIKNGASIQLVYSCLGYGMISFWAAFVYANNGTKKFKLKWLIAGILLILLSNIVRVCVILLAHQKKWYKPFSLNHHTFYNIIAYSLIFLFMLLFLKSLQTKQLKKQ